MRLEFNINYLALMTSVFACTLMPEISLAGPNDGVRCPREYTSQFNNGILKCSRRVTTNPEYRNSVCPFIFAVSTTYQRIANAPDRCTRNDNGATLETVPENAFDSENYIREVDGGASTRDRFRKGGQPQTQFTYPDRL
jgi:hypothetical protein